MPGGGAYLFWTMALFTMDDDDNGNMTHVYYRQQHNNNNNYDNDNATCETHCAHNAPTPTPQYRRLRVNTESRRERLFSVTKLNSFMWQRRTKWFAALNQRTDSFHISGQVCVTQIISQG